MSQKSTRVASVSAACVISGTCAWTQGTRALNWHFFTQGTKWGQGQAFITALGSPLFGQWTGAVTTPCNIQLIARLAF